MLPKNVANGHYLVFIKYDLPTYKATKVIEFLSVSIPEFLSNNIWSLSTPDANSLDFYG